MTQYDPLDQLRQALDIAASPNFAARVRRQVATQPTHAAWWSLRHLAAAAAAVCLVSVAVNQWNEDAAPAVRSAAVVGLSAPAKADVAVAPSSPLTSRADAGGMTTRPRAFPNPAAAPEGVFAEALVPDDQRIALERLLGAIRSGRATVPAAEVDDIVDEDGRRMPRALVIAPLTLDLLLGTPAEPNKDPIKESIK